MTMTSYMSEKRNKKVKNVKKSAYIHYQLKIKGMNFQTIADDLHMSHAAVLRSVGGLSKISRVDEWLKLNLGIEV